MKEIKFCPYCRADIEVGHMFCPKCGKQIPKVPTEPVVEDNYHPIPPISGASRQEPVQQLTAPIAPASGKKSNSMLIIVLITAFLVLSIVLVVGMGNSNRTEVSQTITTVEDEHNEEDEFQPDNDTYSDEEADQDILFNTQYDFACERLVTEDDIVGLNAEDLRYMRNWIYARHGYIFKSQDLREYFSKLPWYNPQYSDVSSMLSNIEKKNVEFIKRHE